MLEPAVRPGGLPVPAKTPTQPIEARSFDSLLEEAQMIDAKTMQGQPLQTQATDGGVTPPPTHLTHNPSGAIGQLSQIDRVENRSLRQLMGNTTPTRPKPEP